MIDNSADESVAELFAWAVQTVGLTIVLSSASDQFYATGSPDYEACRRQAFAVVRRLRQEALAECAIQSSIEDYSRILTSRVLSWCSEHRYFP